MNEATLTLPQQTGTQGTVPIDLRPHFDNRGITGPDELAKGEFNIWSNSFPADELPPPGGHTDVGGLPFLFPAPREDGADNLRCAGQYVELPPGRHDWIYLLAAAERRSEDAVHLHYASGAVDPEWLRVSDFWAETPAHFGESAGLTCTVLHYPRHVQQRMGPSVWRTRVPVPREEDLTAIRLPDNPAIHLFALSLVRSHPYGGTA
ncbi:hypothetical protein AAHZ94_00295 [Streptomyces sp. HSW2009]|uniref:hypothetical protein n=1 Tax=Streptomyces sp. HSW2009 TaxID=3142890 RepID=UPI0032EE4FEE